MKVLSGLELLQVGEADVQLVDMRAAGRFAGTEPEPRAGLRRGHVPGSRNVPFTELVDPRTGLALGDGAITLNSSTEDRLAAARQVLEEKLVRRKVSLKALDYGKVQEAAGATVRQVAGLRAGISTDRSRELNKFIKGLGIKGVQSSTQGDQLRVQSKKRDDLQAVIAALREADFDLPLQYVNFRD